MNIEHESIDLHGQKENHQYYRSLNDDLLIEMEKDFSNIPSELKSFNSWVLWKYDERQNGKKTKLPKKFDGTNASVTNSSHRMSYKNALDAYLSGLGNGYDEFGYQDGSNCFDGIGFILTKDDPFVFIDFDFTEKQDWLELQEQIKTAFADTYMELSPSGRGLHIICRGEIPNGKRRYSCEMYDTERYMTMTGKIVGNVREIAEKQDYVSSLWTYLGGVVSTSGTEDKTPDDDSVTIDDETLLAKAKGASNGNGDLFQALWNGYWQQTGKYDSQSDADLALMNLLSFWSNDDEQIIRLFQQSALGQRNKGKRKDYLEMTLLKSKDKKGIQADIDVFIETLKKKYDLFPKVTNWDEAKDYGINNVKYPPGLVGEIAQYIESISPRPVPLFALAAAFGWMAGMCGRCYNASGTGLNIYQLVIGKSGRGKDAMSKGITKLNNHVIEKVFCKIDPEERSFDPSGPENISSGSALITEMQLKRSCCALVTEFAHIFDSMCGTRPDHNAIALQRQLLAFHGRSGAGDETGATARADKEKIVKPLKRPAFSMLCETTPRRLWNKVNVDSLDDGFFPRFIILEYTGPKPFMNWDFSKPIPAYLAGQIESLATNCNKLNGSDTIREVEFTDEAKAYIKKYDDELTSWVNTPEMDNNPYVELYNRMSINIPRIAGLIAVGKDHINPIIDIDTLLYAIKYVKSAADAVFRRFNNDDASPENLEARQIVDVKRVVKRFLSYREADVRGLNFSPKMLSDNAVPLQFLQRRLGNVSSMKQCSDKNNPPSKYIQQTLNLLCNTGILHEMSPEESFKRYGTKQKCYQVIDILFLNEALTAANPEERGL